MVKSKLGEQFISFCKLILSMVGGFFASYIALDLLSDEPRKLSPNILIGVCTLFGMIMMYYTWKNTRMLAEARDEEESVQGRKLGIVIMYLRIGDIVTQAWFVYAVIACRRAFMHDAKCFLRNLEYDSCYCFYDYYSNHWDYGEESL